MFFVLSKVLAFLLVPFNWVWGLGLAAFLVKNRKWRKRLALAAVAVFLLFSQKTLYKACAGAWESVEKHPDSIGVYEYGVLLTGMVSYNHEMQTGHFSSSSADRLKQTLLLYKKGKVKQLLISGGTSKIWPDDDYREARYLQRYLLTVGVPSDHILVDTAARNTYESAVNVKRMLAKPQAPLLLITSAMHMRRSVACFEKQGFKVVDYGTDPNHYPGEWHFRDFIMPSLSALSGWRSLLHEMIGYAAYKMQGYL